MAGSVSCVALTTILATLGSLGLAIESRAQSREANSAPVTLTRDGVVQLVRERAPQVLAAREQVAIARASLVAARVRRNNPELELAAGPRTLGDERTTDFELGIGQSFELGGRRAARVASVEAVIAGAEATAADVVRQLQREASLAFVRAVHTERSLEVARERTRVVGELVDVARRRLQVGDVGILDVNVATTTLLESEASVSRLEASRALALGELRALLGLDPASSIELKEELAGRRRYDLEQLLSKVGDRADLRALDAEIEAARADERLGRSLGWPDAGLFASYAREEGADVALGGVRLSLPVFDRGQGQRAEAAARAVAAERQREAAERRIVTDVRAAHAAYQLLDAAARRFEEEALPRLTENLDFTRRSYAAGNIAIGEVLVLQRELLEARRAYVDLLLEAAITAVELEARAGWSSP